MRSTRLTEVSGEAFALQEPQPEAPKPTTKEIGDFENKYSNLLALSLRALSQRMIVASASLFTLVLAASAFWLWLSVLPNPSTLQLVGVGMYGIFALTLEFVKRRK